MKLSRIAAFPLTTAMALALAACGGGDAARDGSVPQGEPVAAVKAPAGTSWTETVAETADGGYLLGNPDAPIKLLEYGSLSCPACARFAQEGARTLIDKYVASGKVSWEFRSFAIHPQDVPLTLLATCGGKEPFFPLMEQIYTNFEGLQAPLNDQSRVQAAQASMQAAPEQRFVGFAQALGYLDFFAQRGISANQAKMCLADPAKAEAFAKRSEKYGADGVDSTPTLLVNGVKLDSSSWSDTEAALQRAGAR